MSARPAIIPTLVYDDAPAAIDFLCRAFGFTAQAVYPGTEPGEIAHAQLTRDGQMVMLSSSNPQSRKLSVMSPNATGGVATGGLYVVLDDVDGHAWVAREAGATILMPPEDKDYGGRGYTARDLEGYCWSFGSYDPFA